MKKQQLIHFILAGVISSTAMATITPQPFPGDARITRIAYQDNNVIPITGQTFTSTQLVFGVNERIVDVEGGDRDGWIVTYQKNLPNMLFIKPTILGSNSNVTVVTTRHTYYFHVVSNKQLNGVKKATYAIKFFYPEEARQQLKATLAAQARHKAATLNKSKHPKTYNWNYSFNGAREIMPAHVFDDGVFTYFEMRPNQPLPAIFIVDNQLGEEAVVNLRRQGDLLVVHRTAPQFTLRLGKSQVASVFNNVEINRMKGGRGA